MRCVKLGRSPAVSTQTPLSAVRLHLSLKTLISCHLPKVCAECLRNLRESYTSGTALPRSVCRAPMGDGSLFLLAGWGLHCLLCACKKLSSVTAVSSGLPQIYTMTVELSQRTFLYFLLCHLSHCLQGNTVELWHKQVLIESSLSSVC